MEFYNQICIERLREIMNDNLTEKGRPLKPADLHRKTGVSQKHLSNILTDNKPLTPTTAAKIIRAFPEKRYRLDWLLGESEYKTEFDREKAEWLSFQREIKQAAHDAGTIKNSVIELLKLHGVEFGEPEAPGEITIPSPPAATYNGVTLSHVDISRISDKVFDLLAIELKYIVQERQTVKEYRQSIK